jgi:non-ribosomal peptide synthetase component F
VLPEYLPTVFARFDILLEFTEAQPGAPLKAVLQYSSAIFHEGTIRRFANQLVHFLRSVVQVPSIPIGKANLLSEEDRNLVLYRWNTTDASYPKDKCVHDLFVEQVRALLLLIHFSLPHPLPIQAAKTPSNVALVWDGETMTYAELDKRSAWLGLHLQTLGVGPDTLVGLFVDQSKWMMIVGMLGIWKAGGIHSLFFTLLCFSAYA